VLDGKEIYNLQNKASEVILSNMHKSKFPDRPLVYTLRNADKAFNDIPPTIQGLENYHFALVD